MKEIWNTSKKALYEEIGQDRIMALATRNGEGVASRSVNVYTYDESLYFVTEENSNKYRQLMQNNRVAVSADAIQVTGYAVLLEHPCAGANRAVTSYIEEKLPDQFHRYKDQPVMRLIKIDPVLASFISLETGAGFAIDFVKEEAVPVSHTM